MELKRNTAHINHAHACITQGKMVQRKQQQMNEGSGGHGEIPPQDSNVMGKDMRAGIHHKQACQEEETVESWMAFKLPASPAHQ